MTPLRLANVPPPMALHEVQLENNAIDLAINTSSSLIAVLHNSEVCIYRYEISTKAAQDPVLNTRHAFEHHPAARPRQIAFRDDSEIFVLLDSGDIGESLVYHKTLDQSDFSMLPLDSPKIHTIFTSVDYNKLCIQDDAGAVSTVSADINDGQSSLCRFPVKASWAEVVSHDDEVYPFLRTSNP